MFDTLVRTSVDGAVMVCGIWLLSRLLPHLPAGVKATLWWCAAAKFVVTMAWGAPLMLPVLPAPAETPSTPLARTARTPAGISLPGPAPAPTAAGLATAVADVDWRALLGILWMAGAAVTAGIGVRRWRQMRGIIGRSQPADDCVSALAVEIGAGLALHRRPVVRVSDEVESPLVTGLVRAVILLPRDRFDRMTLEQQRMALCHEMAHIKRGDLWLGCIPAAAERIFFFHPLVRLAAREYIFWREAACDAAVLRALGTAPKAYGRLLLDLGVSASRPALGAAGAAWSFSNLKRRIVMLQQPSTPRLGARLAAATVIALTIVAIAPLRLGARAAVPPAAPPTAVVMPATPALVVAAEPAVEAVDASEAPSHASSQDRDLTYVYMKDGHTNMSGRSGDVERARSFRQGRESLLWFKHEGKEYVIRDEALLKQVEELWAPVSRLGAEQGELGAKQGALGAKQGDIGAEQGRLGARQGILGARQGILGARQGQIAAEQGRLAVRELRATDKERRELEQERRSIDDRLRELDSVMRALGEKMRELEVPMRKLGDEMRVLGNEMEALGRQMEEASRKAEAGMRTLMGRAIASGAAQPVRVADAAR